jgi:hypothetical protein
MGWLGSIAKSDSGTSPADRQVTAGHYLVAQGKDHAIAGKTQRRRDMPTC